MGNLLRTIDGPADLRLCSLRDLQQLAAEIREELVNSVTQTGGHLASNLGVVELTIALHCSFDSPRDKIIWDVGHQSYVHKLLTGRRSRFATLRQLGGLSGFTDPDESPHDPFAAGHACTSISAALGMAVARDLRGEDYHVVAVIGDGSMTGGMALEAVNNAGHLANRLIVVLNDNEMSISPSVGAIPRYLSRLRASPRYYQAKVETERLLVQLPFGRETLAALKRLKHSVKGLVIQTLLWEELGFTYLGPVDGHDILALQAIIRQAKMVQRPVLLHIYTVKGKGYHPAEEDAVKFHGVPPNGSGKGGPISYTKAFSNSLIKLARQQPEVVAITAAMPDGTGLAPFAAEFPSRFFDVGIAEQHAVTFAAGLARQGFRPVTAIYSTFLQRGYDQVIHDVCNQRLPVVFALDRAGIVGDDGRTHQGAFDISYLRCVPNIVVMAPKDENELQHMLCTALRLPGPSALRYPRGSGVGVAVDAEPQPLPVGKAELLATGDDVVILALGPVVYAALAAAQELAARGIATSVVNARFAKPLDAELVLSLARRCPRFVTVEEGALAGGFGSAVLELLASHGLSGVAVRRLGLPDAFVEHGPQSVMRERYSLTPAGIVRAVEERFPSLLLQPCLVKRSGDEER